MEKLSYDLKIIRMKEDLEKRFLRQGLTADTRYLDYYNDICPRCGNTIKTYRGEVKGIGSVSAFVVLEQKKAVLYGLCKECSKRIAYGPSIEHETKQTEERIFSKIPDLERKDKEIPSEEELKKEKEILRSL